MKDSYNGLNAIYKNGSRDNPKYWLEEIDKDSNNKI